MLKGLEEKGNNKLSRSSPKRRSLGRRNIFSLVILCLVIIVLLWIAGIRVWSFAASRLVDVEVLRYAKINHQIEEQALLIKRETVINAPARGKIEYLAAEGERVRLGTPVAVLHSPDLNSTAGQTGTYMYAPGAGIFCLHIDGYEQVLAPDKLGVLQIPKLEKITVDSTDSSPVEQQNTKVWESGQPVYKLVDNLYPLLLKLEVPITKWPENLLRSGHNMGITWQGYTLNGNIVDYKQQGAVWDITLSVRKYPNELVHYRKIQVAVITRELSGLFVDRKSIVVKDGQPGIYTLNKLVSKWVPVTLKGQLESKVIVEGEELAEGTRYVYNPILYKIVSLLL